MTGKAEVDRLRQRLEATFERGRAVSDIETQADFAKYLCILVSGYLEKAVAEIILEHARRSGGPTLQRYVEANIKRFTNAKAGKLKSLLGNFHPDWPVKLDAILKDEYKDAVDSVVTLRHSIAHGGTATVTFSRISEYYIRVQKVVDEIATLCVP